MQIVTQSQLNHTANPTPGPLRPVQQIKKEVQASPTMHLVTIIITFLLAIPLVISCSIPPPSIECQGSSGCTVFNYQGLWEDHTPCKAARSVYPTTERELVAAVAEAVKNKQKINVISAWAHGSPKLACVGEGGVIVSTRSLASTLSVNAAANTITVDSGVVLRDLIDAAAKAGLAFPTSTSWDGLSVGGTVSTGAHGSSLYGKGSTINEYVVGMRLVVPAAASEGYAKVVQLTEADEDLKAARFSLGTLGAISQITFAVMPMFKRSATLSLQDDNGLEDGLEIFLNSARFGIVYWYPGQGKTLMENVNDVSVDVPGDGLVSGYQSTTVSQAEKGAANYETIEAEEDADLLCNMTRQGMSNRVPQGGGFLNDGVTFTGYPVVGLNSRMQASGRCQDYHLKEDNVSSCTPTGILDKNQSICYWDRRANVRMYYDLEIRVPLSRARDAIIDVKRIRDLNPKALCGLEGSGIIFRTFKKSEAYLGFPEDMVTFEIAYSRSREAFVPMWNMDVYQEIEQMLIEKHGGNLHWGKSGGHLFEGLANRTVNLQKFLTVKQRFDPDGLFSNEWMEGLLGIGGKRVEVLTKGCALEKLCKCREDIHCAPEKGYYCRPGRIWENARVCRKGN